MGCLARMNIQICYDEKEFIKDTIRLWGSNLPELSEPNEGIHYYMTMLAEAIRLKEISANEVLDFLNSILQKDIVNSEIENAVAISFLEYTELTNLDLLNSTPDLVTNILKKQHEKQWDKQWDSHIVNIVKLEISNAI